MQMSIGRKWKEIIDVTDKISFSFHVNISFMIINIFLFCSSHFIDYISICFGWLQEDLRREKSAKSSRYSVWSLTRSCRAAKFWGKVFFLLWLWECVILKNEAFPVSTKRVSVLSIYRWYYSWWTEWNRKQEKGHKMKKKKKKKISGKESKSFSILLGQPD